jgi:hypothetical protein
MMNVFPWWQVLDDVSSSYSLICHCSKFGIDDVWQCPRCEFGKKLATAIMEGAIRPLNSEGVPWSVTPSLVRFQRDSKNHCVSVHDINKWLSTGEFSEYEWKPICVAKATNTRVGRPLDKRSLRELENNGDLAIKAKIAYNRLKKEKKNVSITKDMVAGELKTHEYRDYLFEPDTLAKKIRVKQFK